jgi:hypothetical protein
VVDLQNVVKITGVPVLFLFFGFFFFLAVVDLQNFVQITGVPFFFLS